MILVCPCCKEQLQQSKSILYRYSCLVKTCKLNYHLFTSIDDSNSYYKSTESFFINLDKSKQTYCSVIQNYDKPLTVIWGSNLMDKVYGRIVFDIENPNLLETIVSKYETFKNFK